MADRGRSPSSAPGDGRLVPFLDPVSAYMAMYDFIQEYWVRVSRPDELGELLEKMRYTPGAGTADPEMWQRWLVALEKVQANRPA